MSLSEISFNAGIGTHISLLPYMYDGNHFISLHLKFLSGTGQKKIDLNHYQQIKVIAMLLLDAKNWANANVKSGNKSYRTYISLLKCLDIASPVHSST